jgi:hypothetical protein
VRCPRCGNDNPETNRFCGMCGASLVRTPDAASSPRNAESPPAASRSATPQIIKPSSGSAAHAAVQSFSHTSAVAPASGKPSDDKTSHDKPTDKQSAIRESAATDTEPVITGPSFLGLNRPSSHAAGIHSESSAKDAHEHLRSSRNVDYLLEDDEEPKHGWGKLLLVVVALALAVGFGYLHWKQGGFDWVTGGEKKPAPTAASPKEPASGSQPGSATPSTTPNGNASQSTAEGASTTPSGSTAQPGSASGSNPRAGATPESSSPSAPASAPPQANPSQAASQNAAATSESSRNAPPSPSSQGQPDNSNSPQKSGSTTASSAEAQPTPEETAPKPKPHKHSAAVPLDTVTEAERYIYGRGVRQDCDHGLRLLKRAAEQSNPKAMSSMGSLYSTGTCTPRDLPTAYRWYALALHQEPDNQALQNDLQKLWSQMTQPERQLAIKLSQ